MTTVWTGLAIGAIYAMVAIGYDIVYIASGHFNFAHAQFVTVGAFGAFVVLVQHSWAWIFVLPVVLAAGLICGVVEERVAIRPLRGRPESTQLVTTLAFSVIISGTAAVWFGTDPRRVPFVGRTRSLSILGGLIEPVELVLIIAAVVLTIAMELLARRTLWGLAALAVAEDRPAAQLRGVNVGALSIGAFALAGMIGALVGPLAGPKTYAVFDLGNVLAVKGFLALAIGGFGSLTGSLIGGLTAGLVEAFASRQMGPAQSDLVVFGVLLVILLVRPRGLFGTRAERAV